jgi:hypothetical protein
LTNSVTALAYPSSSSAGANPSSHLIALGLASGDILLWNTARASVETRLGVTSSQGEKHQAAITSLAFHSSGSFLFSASADKTLKQWTVQGGAFVASFRGEEAATASFSAIALSPDGQLIVAGGGGALTLWNISAPSAPAREYQGPTDRISCLAFSCISISLPFSVAPLTKTVTMTVHSQQERQQICKHVNKTRLWKQANALGLAGDIRRTHRMNEGGACELRIHGGEDEVNALIEWATASQHDDTTGKHAHPVFVLREGGNEVIHKPKGSLALSFAKKLQGNPYKFDVARSGINFFIRRTLPKTKELNNENKTSSGCQASDHPTSDSDPHYSSPET